MIDSMTLNCYPSNSQSKKINKYWRRNLKKDGISKILAICTKIKIINLNLSFYKWKISCMKDIEDCSKKIASKQDLIIIIDHYRSKENSCAYCQRIIK